jgi:hypothetical protein
MWQKSGTSPPCPSPQDHDVKLKSERFSPPRQIVWQARGGLGFPSHHQGRPSLISLISHEDP